MLGWVVRLDLLILSGPFRSAHPAASPPFSSPPFSSPRPSRSKQGHAVCASWTQGYAGKIPRWLGISEIPSPLYPTPPYPPPSSAMCREAAALACVCRAAASAALASKWRSVNGVRVGRRGKVAEPASGVFDVTVAPGEDVQASVDRCPPGGCVLLLPGTHAGPLVLGQREERMAARQEWWDDRTRVLTADKVVHVFGRGLATLRTAAGNVVTSRAAEATCHGLIIQREAGGGFGDGVLIRGGSLRLQACDVTNAAGSCIVIQGGDPVLNQGFRIRRSGNPVLDSCRRVGVKCANTRPKKRGRW